MARANPELFIPQLGKDRRPYDLAAKRQLRAWSHHVTQRLDRGANVIGSTLPSGPRLVLPDTDAYRHITGTAAIATIVPPTADFTGPVWFLADGAWTTVTTGNIQAAITATVGRVYGFISDTLNGQQKWWII